MLGKNHPKNVLMYNQGSFTDNGPEAEARIPVRVHVQLPGVEFYSHLRGDIKVTITQTIKTHETHETHHEHY